MIPTQNSNGSSQGCVTTQTERPAHTFDQTRYFPPAFTTRKPVPNPIVPNHLLGKRNDHPPWVSWCISPGQFRPNLGPRLSASNHPIHFERFVPPHTPDVASQTHPHTLTSYVPAHVRYAKVTHAAQNADAVRRSHCGSYFGRDPTSLKFTPCHVNQVTQRGHLYQSETAKYPKE